MHALIVLVVVSVILIVCPGVHSFRTCQIRLSPSQPILKPLFADVFGTGAATVLKCNSLSKSFTGLAQLSQVSFNLAKGQRMGLIGRNGAGKSTFLRCLSGLDAADSGTVEYLSGSNVIYVDQEPKWCSERVLSALFSGPQPAAVATRQYYDLLQNEGSNDIDSNGLERVMDAMQLSYGWEYQERGLSIAGKLNIGEGFMYRLMDSLSGGQKKRVALAAALLKQPNVLLLDEPTNHLDIDALEWLAEYLRPGNAENKDLTVLMVTHDRSFLQRVCTEIIELDRGALHRYPGNYERYLQLKEERLAAEDAEAERARTKLRREREWMLRQPQARQAKSKAREMQYYDLVTKAKGRSEDSTKQVQLSSPDEQERQQRLGGVVAEFRSAQYTLPAVSQGQDATTSSRVPLLNDFTYSFRQRDRIAIVGSNGVGKSTFLRILAEQLELDSGTLRIGDTVRLGYYTQGGLNLTAAQEASTVLQFVQEAVEKGAALQPGTMKEAAPQIVIETGPALGRRKQLAGKEAVVSVQVSTTAPRAASVAYSEKEAMTLLQRFQFPPKRWQDRVGRLSGGERRRLQLLQVLAKTPNVLLLDEPSNDFDLETLTALEEYLAETFDGCLVVVSHDAFFVNRIAEHIFVFEGNGVVKDFQGSYDDYLMHRKELTRRPTAVNKAVQTTDAAVVGEPPAACNPPKNAQQSKEARKQASKLEKEIVRLEAEKVRIEEELVKVSSTLGKIDAVQLGALRDQLQGIEHLLKEAEDSWLSLNE